MPLSEFNQRLLTTVNFVMDCPKCRSHKISVPVGIQGWTWNIERQTLTPSINFDNGTCKTHFSVTEGNVIFNS